MKNRNDETIHVNMGKEGLQNVFMRLFARENKSNNMQGGGQNVLEATVDYINALNDERQQIFEYIKQAG